MARGCWLFLLVLSLFSTACAAGTRLPDASRSEAGTDAGPVDAGPPDAGMMDAGAPDAGSLDAGLIDGGPPDAGPDAGPIDAGPCGAYTQACCAGDSCSEGACLGGRCAAYGGIYALEGESSDECVGNPLNSNMCACPAGFVEELLEEVDGDTSGGTGWETRMFHCRAATDVPGADYRGGYGARIGETPTGCVGSCQVANTYGGDCGCPGGAAELLRGVHFVPASTGPDCHREVGLCRDTDAAPYTYGGFFWEQTDTGVVCEETDPADRCRPNAATGDCSCPAGFVQTRMKMMQLHANEARAASNIFCRGRLTVCQRLPE